MKSVERQGNVEHVESVSCLAKLQGYLQGSTSREYYKEVFCNTLLSYNGFGTSVKLFLHLLSASLKEEGLHIRCLVVWLKTLVSFSFILSLQTKCFIGFQACLFLGSTALSCRAGRSVRLVDSPQGNILLHARFSVLRLGRQIGSNVNRRWVKTKATLGRTINAATAKNGSTKAAGEKEREREGEG